MEKMKKKKILENSQKFTSFGVENVGFFVLYLFLKKFLLSILTSFLSSIYGDQFHPHQWRS